MKKRRLKNWVENILLFINLTLFIILISGIEYFLDNIILLIIILIILILNTIILFKYSNLLKEGE